MEREKSTGAVIFYSKAHTIYYLVVQYRHQGWEFVRGHIEPGEREIETAQREIAEETKLEDLQFIDNFREEKTWTFTKSDGTPVTKQAVFFLARSYSMNVQLNEENLSYRWLPYESAYAILAFDESKEILEKAHRHVARVCSP